MVNVLALALSLAIGVLTACSGVGTANAQPAAGEKRAVDKASPKLMTGKVTQVDPGAKVFTIMAGGKAVTFNAGRLRALPKVGDTVDVTYTETPGGAMEASNLDLSKSNVN